MKPRSNKQRYRKVYVAGSRLYYKLLYVPMFCVAFWKKKKKAGWKERRDWVNAEFFIACCYVYVV